MNTGGQVERVRSKRKWYVRTRKGRLDIATLTKLVEMMRESDRTIAVMLVPETSMFDVIGVHASQF